MVAVLIFLMIAMLAVSFSPSDDYKRSERYHDNSKNEPWK